MSEHGTIPENINYPVLIDELRKTFIFGDGGLSAASGISDAVLSRCAKNGVHSLKNGVRLWNLAMDRLSPEKRNGCLVEKPVVDADCQTSTS